MNDDHLEEWKKACDCDVNALLAAERQFATLDIVDSKIGGYVFCAKHGLWVRFDWVKAA